MASLDCSGWRFSPEARFYNQQHPFYCGVDLHAKTLHLCVLDQAGEIQRHRGIRARPRDFLRTIEPYRKPTSPEAKGEADGRQGG